MSVETQKNMEVCPAGTCETQQSLPEGAVPRKIPVTVLTGFLGSGKTTLLNYILKENHGKKIAIIENEYGEVGVDDALVLDSEEEIFEMNNGCICCTVRGDLIRILGNLARRRDRFDYVLVETTGLADPGPIAQTFFMDQAIQAAYSLDGIITMVDSKHLLQHLEEQKPDGVENESVEQIAFADRILLNKIDLVTPEELKNLEAKIKSINGVAQVHRTLNSQIDLNKILDVKAFDLGRVLDMDPQFLEDAEHMHDTTVTSVGISNCHVLDMQKFQSWISGVLRKQGVDIFRSKGILNFAGKPDRFVFQAVHMLFDGGFDKPWPVDGKRENKMVFIGRNLNRAELNAGFDACIVTRVD